MPPILMDLTTRFPAAMNAPLPDALFFYPAIALVAEVQFHLTPLAQLALVVPRSGSVPWLVGPAILVEPLFQVAASAGLSLQSFLMLGDVTLISAAQLWLYLRFGYGAMFGLRIAFYLFRHILWGAPRLELLF